MDIQTNTLSERKQTTMTTYCQVPFMYKYANVNKSIVRENHSLVARSRREEVQKDIRKLWGIMDMFIFLDCDNV